MKIAFQGEPGAYGEQAVFNYFGDVETLPRESFDAVFDAVVSGESDAGLIPIENSLAGSIHQNYDLLLRHDLHIIGEYQALGQCSAYLRGLGVKPEAVYDTAGSVKMLKESGARDTAAIASRRAAQIYGMQILEEGIEDDPENYTRFLAISKTAARGPDG
jgi:prephenate dehydratase